MCLASLLRFCPHTRRHLLSSWRCTLTLNTSHCCRSLATLALWAISTMLPARASDSTVCLAYLQESLHRLLLLQIYLPQLRLCGLLHNTKCCGIHEHHAYCYSVNLLHHHQHVMSMQSIDSFDSVHHYMMQHCMPQSQIAWCMQQHSTYCTPVEPSHRC